MHITHGSSSQGLLPTPRFVSDHWWQLFPKNVTPLSCFLISQVLCQANALLFKAQQSGHLWGDIPLWHLFPFLIPQSKVSDSVFFPKQGYKLLQR